MAHRLFGTDGVRGVANVDLTAPLALKLGAAAGHWMRTARAAHAENHKAARPFVVIGRDTRLSGDMLEAALAAGLASMGVDVVNVGVVPTPAVARIVLSLGAAGGAVISASHNPFEDNGIKFFGANGKKLPDRVEDEMQAILETAQFPAAPIGGEIGRIDETVKPVEQYVERVMATVDSPDPQPLGQLRLVMDCANGAAYALGPRIFRELGAQLDVMCAAPDGVNINVDCGSTRPQALARRVVETGADAGLAFDGDADRVMFADETGAVVDGDRMMAIIALTLKQRGRLPGDVVVATIMSNVGLEQALAGNGIRLHRTDVGDRYVAEAMDDLGAAVGGEQSGHILLPALTPTGDGLVTALQVLRVMRESGKRLSEMASVVRSCPQLLKNVRVHDKRGWQEDPEIQRAIAEGRERLGNPEWLSVRASGTEPLIRVMAQGTSAETVVEVVDRICSVVANRLGKA